jgi:hypothetical protein
MDGYPLTGRGANHGVGQQMWGPGLGLQVWGLSSLIGGSDIPAWLGLNARALAWPEAALAFKIVRPSHEPKPGQSWGLALACVELAADKT